MMPSGSPSPSKNVTSPVSPTKPAVFTGAASTFGGSMAVAGLAAIGAVFLA